MRALKDRDFLRTVEGFLFCVVGYSHPRERIISYLKYAPSSEGKWGKGGERYARTMQNYTIHSLLSNIEILTQNYPHYVFRSCVFNIQMSAVPNRYIAERYFTEVKLREIYEARNRDPLQEEVVELVSFLSCESGVPKEDFGVTGSILTDIHNPVFSDVDLTVCGTANSWKVKEMLEEATETTLFRRCSIQQRKEVLGRFVKNYPLTYSEAEEVYDRRWNYGFFKGRAFSIHAIRKDEEIEEMYGEKCYFPQGIVEGKAEVVGIEKSLFLPCTYEVIGFKIGQGDVPIEVGKVVSYDGLYAGLFNRGEHVLVRGKLEKVVDRGGDGYFRVLVGSPEAKGRDYIKPSK